MIQLLEKISNDHAIVICKKAIENFGEAIQKVVAMEECSELIQALIDFKNGNSHNVEEEIADVEIICTQLEIMHNADKIKEFDRRAFAIEPNKITDSAIKSLAMLIQSISKSLRDKGNNVEVYISNVKALCKMLRIISNETKIEEIKQQKLERLKVVVW
ncbi:hypothetical protein FC777_11225 [Clostridium botulinum]|nr:hypothetical protein [Clostridium botulinum]